MMHDVLANKHAALSSDSVSEYNATWRQRSERAVPCQRSGCQ